MPYHLTKTFSVDALFENTVLLSEVEGHRKLLQRSGIYVLHEGLDRNEEFSPYLAKVLYIGKAIEETVYSRSRKHKQAFAEHGLSKDNAKMRPGKRFQEYRASTAGLGHELFLTAAFMEKDLPHLISCTEEYLIHSYWQQHGHRPRANTK